MSRNAIKDEFTDLPISRQQKYQLRKRKEGRCILCAKKRHGDTDFCKKHLERKRSYQRERRKDQVTKAE